MQSELDYKQFEFTPRQREMMLDLAENARRALREQRVRALDEERDFRPPLEPIDQLLNDISKFIYHAEDAQYKKLSLSKPLLINLIFELMQRMTPSIEEPTPALGAVQDEQLRLYYFLSFGFTYHFAMQEYHGYIDQFRPAEELARSQRFAHHYINTAGMNEVAVFTALYNAANPQGMGFHQDDPQNITEEEGAKLYYATTPASERDMDDEDGEEGDFLKSRFDYVNGRRMKLSRRDIERGYIDVTNYDVGNGVGAAQKAVEHLPRI
ncbi:hypothetical protein E4631_23250 [Hymenobacter sp. UV11]|uniref:hypothetical protein n=1 Tax=Hymenobacter sp. UV11 TaxID=1849735 RepID=UPI00105D3F53|nr:hypothetical protein [Hymenobacter sp. UV11]TDN39853.1 hypothetical protein A8B98_16815 [Hymenobacter sp. UV11]TFZ63224.1 hypothetical protein E4631_23250 [Hymenobacter sp. UV11]